MVYNERKGNGQGYSIGKEFRKAVIGGLTALALVGCQTTSEGTSSVEGQKYPTYHVREFLNDGDKSAAILFDKGKKDIRVWTNNSLVELAPKNLYFPKEELDERGLKKVIFGDEGVIYTSQNNPNPADIYSLKEELDERGLTNELKLGDEGIVYFSQEIDAYTSFLFGPKRGYLNLIPKRTKRKNLEGGGGDNPGTGGPSGDVSDDSPDGSTGGGDHNGGDGAASR